MLGNMQLVLLGLYSRGPKGQETPHTTRKLHRLYMEHNITLNTLFLVIYFIYFPFTEEICDLFVHLHNQLEIQFDS